MTAQDQRLRGPARALLVIDQLALAGVVTRALGHGQYITSTVRTDGDAGRAHAEWKPHLVILDMDGAGHAILERLVDGSCGGTPVPVIALTRRGDLDARLNAFDRGVDDILTVPFPSEELAARGLRGDAASLSRLRRVHAGPSARGFGDRHRQPAPDLSASDAFDAGRVRLADTDGSGTTDLIYLGADGWSVHVNCAGNGFAPPRVWISAPPLDALARVDAFDLLGNGTACLVWSTQLPVEGEQIRYLPLAGGLKPYLLTGARNGLGLDTRLDYAPSTVFPLRDRMAGTPWVTRLPFPVHVVERIETHDRISGHHFISQYAYHHGAYDPREREFRGFGFVEQWDSEHWSATPRPSAPNEDEASQVPPVRTKRWFHTGMASPGMDMSHRYERDFFGHPDGTADAAARDLFTRTRIADVEAAADLSARDHRDICRALKGSLLREEIYADDRSPRARLPYKIAVAGYEVEVRQTAGAAPAVVFVHPRETLDVQLERQLATPRVAQTFVLTVGRFGDVLERVELSHGGPVPAFPGPGPATIALPRAFVDETEVTNHIDAPETWRKPQQAETRRFALVGAGLTAAWPLARSAIRTLVRGATPLAPTDATNPAATPCGKRLIARARAVFRRDDLTAPLPFRELQPKAIPYESYALAFTPALLARTYGARIPAGAALGEAGYVDLEGDGNLWMPSGRAYCVRRDTLSGRSRGDESIGASEVPPRPPRTRVSAPGRHPRASHGRPRDRRNQPRSGRRHRAWGFS